uniref:Uncharacterized protein n=1 Tax=Arundo donax TaxID=35708 RepID=A0A0A9HBL1_ARUDO
MTEHNPLQMFGQWQLSRTTLCGNQD